MGSPGRRRRNADITVDRQLVVVAVACLSMFAPPAGALSPGGDVPRRLVLESGLLVRLRTLAEGLHNEIVLCLTGAADSLSVVATGFVMPYPRLSSSDRASFGPCPDATVAIWHNHPLVAPREPGSALSSNRRPMADPDASPRDLCALSDADIQAAARAGSPFVVVAVGADTWCWWSSTQVHALAERQAMRGDPVPGQIESSAPPRALNTRTYQRP